METNQEEFIAPDIDEFAADIDSDSEEFHDGLGGYASSESIDRFYLSDTGSAEPNDSSEERQWRIDHSSGDYKLRRKSLYHCWLIVRVEPLTTRYC